MNVSSKMPSHLPLGEPEGHVAARRMQSVVRMLLAVSLIATVILFFSYSQAAYLAAIPVPVLTVVLVFLSYLERGSRAEVLRRKGQTAISQEEIDVDVETIGIITVLKVLGGLAVGAFIVAAAFFDLTMLGVAAALGFLLAVLYQIFFFPLFFTESERDERKELTGTQD